MLFKGSISGMEESESLAPSRHSPLLERDLPPIPDPTSPAPLFSNFSETYVPPWMRDTTSVASTARQSRASSIVSNMTRFTTTSVDDARSIDIRVGGQSFRIARDASKITSEAPPPYTAHEAESRLDILEEIRPRTAPIKTPADDTGSDLPRRLPTRPMVTTTLGANILDPSEVDIPSPVDDDVTPPSTPRSGNRNPNRNETDSNQSVQNQPTRHSNHVDSQDTLTKSLTVRPYKSARPRERTDLPLLSTTSNAVEMQGMRSRSNQPKSWQTMSAEDLLMTHPEHHSHEPQSPNYIGRHADGVFPTRATVQNRLRSDSGYSGEEDGLIDDDSSETPSMDNENDISLHYARMIRFVDKQHRRALHLRDKEMEKLRIRASEIDTVYRQELKARDFIIEDLKKRLSHLEDSMETKLERARNEVEDLWERRWKDREFHLRESMSRIESQAGFDLLRSRTNLACHDGEE